MLEKETDNSGGVNMDHSEKLEKLQQLLDGGIITQEEFDAKKEQIMKQTEAATTEAVVEEVEVVEFAVADNEASTAAPVLQGTADDDLQSKRAALIGKNAEHYLPIFEKLDQSGGSSWNWCGFFFAPFWFAYRKVYGWVAIAMIVPLLLGIVVGIFVYSSSADDAIANVIIRVSSLAVNIVFAILANGIYKKRIDKLVNEMPEDPAERTKFIESKGGVSVVATVISIAIYIGLYLFI